MVYDTAHSTAVFRNFRDRVQKQVYLDLTSLDKVFWASIKKHKDKANEWRPSSGKIFCLSSQATFQTWPRRKRGFHRGSCADAHGVLKFLSGKFASISGAHPRCELFKLLLQPRFKQRGRDIYLSPAADGFCLQHLTAFSKLQPCLEVWALTRFKKLTEAYFSETGHVSTTKCRDNADVLGKV